MKADLNSMTVFLFSDIEGSTQLWEQHPDAMHDVVKCHDAIISNNIAKHGGQVVKFTGDGVFAVFEGGQPLACTIDLQRTFINEEWEGIGDIRIRIGLHAGKAEKHGGDYHGPDVNRAARVMSAAWGNQILLTKEARSTRALPQTAAIEDLGAHMLKDLAEPIQLFMLSHPDIRQDFPPPRSLSAHPNNLPAQTTPFIGRKREINEIASMLGEECRVLTLLGPGGIGKTRLGLQTAAEKIENYKHGVYVVPLAPLSSADAIVQSVADSLKYSFNGKDDPKNQLVDYLHSKQMLLLFDNFEHLVEDTGLIMDIVNRAPDVQVITTSRTRLNMAIECVYEVGGMQVPADKDDEVFEVFEAVDMFLTYARRVQADYTLADNDRVPVLKICQLGGGMPLAIELAATWIRMLPPSEIVRELEANLDFLAVERADVPERQRSMRAVYDYSWKMLSQAEQDALMKLSVFRGGFTRQAGKVVTGTTLQALAGLVDKSLVKWRHGAERYEVHELIREFAEQALRESGQIDETKNNHRIYYLKAVSEKVNDLKGGAQLKALDDISLDFENVRAAWKWALFQRSWQLIDQAAEGLYLFLRIRTHPGEAVKFFGSVTLALADRIDTAEQIVCARASSFLYALDPQAVGHYETQQNELESALGLFEKHGSMITKGQCFEALSFLSIEKSDWKRALYYARQGLQAYEIGNDLFYVGRMQVTVGYLAGWVEEDNITLYVDGHLQGLKIAQTINDFAGIARVASNLGWSDAVDSGNFVRATENALLAVKYARDMGDHTNFGHSNTLLGLIELLDGELETSRDYLRQGESTAREFNHPNSLAYALGIRAALECVEENYQTAIELAEESIRAKTNPIGDVYGQWGLALAYTGLHEFELARTALHTGLSVNLSLNTIINLDFLPCAAVILHVDGFPRRAVEALSLSINDPRAAKGWKRKWPVITELKASLKETIGDDIYKSAWRRGETLDLHTVSEELIEKFSDENSG